MSIEFIWPIKVYYEDTDAGGVVYYANYLKFFERARSEWFNSLGFDQADLLIKNIAFAVKRAEVDYIKPARLNDDLQVISCITEVTGVSVTFKQQILLVSAKAPTNQPILCEAVIKTVCLKLSSFSPCRLPAVVKEELQRVS